MVEHDGLSKGAHRDDHVEVISRIQRWQREHTLSRALDALEDRPRIRPVSADLARAYHFLCAHCQRSAARAVQTVISSDRCDRLVFQGFARRRCVDALTADPRSGRYLRGYSGWAEGLAAAAGNVL
jgi:hypothetical protein